MWDLHIILKEISGLIDRDKSIPEGITVRARYNRSAAHTRSVL